jgi:predicted permease
MSLLFNMLLFYTGNQHITVKDHSLQSEHHCQIKMLFRHQGQLLYLTFYTLIYYSKQHIHLFMYMPICKDDVGRYSGFFSADCCFSELAL